MRYSLSAADQERLGCVEWLDLNLDNLPIETCIDLEEQGGEYATLINGGAKGIKARVWLALRDAGLAVEYRSLTFDVAGVRFEGQGKAPSSDESETSTSPTS